MLLGSASLINSRFKINSFRATVGLVQTQVIGARPGRVMLMFFSTAAQPIHVDVAGGSSVASGFLVPGSAPPLTFTIHDNPGLVASSWVANSGGAGQTLSIWEVYDAESYGVSNTENPVSA